MEYEIDRRYPFEATADSVCPVPDDAMVCIWLDSDEGVMNGTRASYHGWKTYNGPSITHFMVLSYPAEKHTGWINVYGDEAGFCGCGHTTREGADGSAGSDITACIKIEWTEGEGL